MSKKALPLDKKKKIAPKHRLFVDTFFRVHNISEAYEATIGKAKYSAQSGWMVLQRPEVQEYIEQRLQRLEQETDLHRAEIVRELWNLANSNIANYIEPATEDGDVKIKDITTLPESQQKAVRDIRIDLDPQTGRTRRVSIRLHGKQEALSDLADILGLRKGSGGGSRPLVIFPTVFNGNGNAVQMITGQHPRDIMEQHSG